MGKTARGIVRVGALALCGAALTGFAHAGAVTATTTLETYTMDGDTPAGIVDYFHRHPFSGDHGPALANMRYTSDLSLATGESGDRCRVTSARLDLDFVITLPAADEFTAMSRRTQTMWNQLAAFARAHEYGHRAMYLQCARNFAARAERVSGESCGSVESAVRGMLNASEAACDASQVGYDRREALRAANLAMFRAARLER